MTDFQVGDRVVFTSDESPVWVGSIGTVVNWFDDIIEVLFDGYVTPTSCWDYSLDLEYRPINDPSMYDKTLFD